MHFYRLPERSINSLKISIKSICIKKILYKVHLMIDNFNYSDFSLSTGWRIIKYSILKSFFKGFKIAA